MPIESQRGSENIEDITKKPEAVTESPEQKKVLEMTEVYAEIDRISEFDRKVKIIDKKVEKYKKILEYWKPEGSVVEEWISDLENSLGIEEEDLEKQKNVLNEFSIFRGSTLTKVFGSSIEHDIKNIQTRFLSFGLARRALVQADFDDFIKNWEEASVRSSAYYYTMLDYAARAKDVIDGGKGFAVNEEFIVTEGKGADIHDMIDVLLKSIRVSASKHGTVQVHYPAAVPEGIYARIAPGIIYNKLANIILNPVRKTDSLKARNVWVEMNVEEDSAGKNLLIVVKDDGIGMNPEVRQRVFEGGFTTTKGKGIGLAHADTLFSQMNCSISVESESVIETAGNGEVHTTFTIKIPLSA